MADISNTCDVGGRKVEDPGVFSGSSGSVEKNVSAKLAGKGQLEEHEFFGFMRKIKEREAAVLVHGDQAFEEGLKANH